MDMEAAHYDSTLVFYSLILLAMTMVEILSAYVFMIIVLFGLLREPALHLYSKFSKKGTFIAEYFHILAISINQKAFRLCIVFRTCHPIDRSISRVLYALLLC